MPYLEGGPVVFTTEQRYRMDFSPTIQSTDPLPLTELEQMMVLTAAGGIRLA